MMNLYLYDLECDKEYDLECDIIDVVDFLNVMCYQNHKSDI
jgi:hypothetical protein